MLIFSHRLSLYLLQATALHLFMSAPLPIGLRVGPVTKPHAATPREDLHHSQRATFAMRKANRRTHLTNDRFGNNSKPTNPRGNV